MAQKKKKKKQPTTNNNNNNNIPNKFLRKYKCIYFYGIIYKTVMELTRKVGAQISHGRTERVRGGRMDGWVVRVVGRVLLATYVCRNPKMQ